MSKPWFEFKAAEDPVVAEVYVFGLIGDWSDDFWGDAKERGITTAKDFVEALAALPAAVKTIRVRINSVGGDVFGGITIANALRAEQQKGRKVETIVEGLAASAASVVAQGGSVVRMSDNALMMVHAPWTVAGGNARDLRSVADQLDTVRDALVKTYQWHSEKSPEELLDLIDGEDGQGTWLDADAAIEAGLATEKVEGLRAAASIDPKAAARLQVPERFAARVQALLAVEAEPGAEIPPVEEQPAPELAAVVVPAGAIDGADVQDLGPGRVVQTEPVQALEVMRLCVDAGLDLAFANELARSGVEQAALVARVSGERERRAQAHARETEIRNLCKTARLDDLADSYVTGGMTVAQVRDQLTRITAKVDEAAQTDGTLGPDHGTKPKAVIDITAIYARLNGLQSKE